MTRILASTVASVLVAPLFSLVVLSSAASHAAVVTVNPVAITQSGRQVVKASNGNYYIQQKSGEPVLASAQDVYEAYRAQMRAAMADDSATERERAAVRSTGIAGAYRNQGFFSAPTKRVIGVTLPGLKKTEGYLPMNSDPSLKTDYPMRGTHVGPSQIETDKNEGALLVGNCHQVQNGYDHFNEFPTGCYASVLVFVKLNRHRSN